MSATLTAESPETVPPLAFQGNVAPTATGRKRWTRDECEILENAGILCERYELIDGEILLRDGSRRKWTVSECEWLESAFLLHGPYELLEGEIVVKMGQRGLHASAVMLVIAYLLGIYGKQRVRTQATLEIVANGQVQSRPEPDLAVLRAPSIRTPRATDVLLAIEISDTTQGDDFGTKSRLYANADIEEYWVLDLRRRLLVVHRYPLNGEWGERQELPEAESIAPLSSPESLVRIADLLP